MIEGVVRAASRDAALRALRGQQLWPIEVSAATAPVGVELTRRVPLLSGLGRRRAVTLWIRTVATLLDAGATIERALSVAETQAVHHEMRSAAVAVRRAVQSGASLADALTLQPALFSGLHVGLVRAGEASGEIRGSLSTLADALDEEDALRAQLTSALIYPALMTLVASLGILVLLLFVVPRFSTMLSDLGGTLPLSTRVLVAVGNAVTQGWWILAVLIGAAVVAARIVLASPDATRAWHARRLQFPLTGALERRMATAQFTRSLGLMLTGGTPLLPALRLATTGVTNRALRAELERATQSVMRGDGLAAALSGTLDPMALQLLAVGEEGGRLDALALKAAAQQDESVRRTLRTLVSLLEPALILCFGGIVGFVALAMLQAIYAVNAGM